ncbi:hypothetical protein TetV_037 [Tetraselmis virus 1]|uniref:SF3 helicase domain-containing protein n=1 Tax=Tetraselmis virus 1 TaxID=2060617 RepID=A0A2P0VN23_9VIRU|nr:hypothetical protein QJ968_gp037 [Tetraselmis virus 1]AUF82129.1 hypothetical protein TetV_037 [Tetraselmis virus 1]
MSGRERIDDDRVQIQVRRNEQSASWERTCDDFIENTLEILPDHLENKDDIRDATRNLLNIYKDLKHKSTSPNQSLNQEEFQFLNTEDLFADIQQHRSKIVDSLLEGRYEVSEKNKIRIERIKGIADRCREMAYGLKIIDQASKLYRTSLEETDILINRISDAEKEKGDEKDDDAMEIFLETRKLTGIESGGSKGKKVSPFNRLILYVQFCLRNEDYRRYGELVYKRVRNSENLPTIAWNPVSSLEQFIYKVCDKSVNPDMWLIIAQPSDVVSSVVRYFVKSKDPEFPDLKKRKSMFSFDNGVYLADTNEFFKYPLSADCDLSYGEDIPSKHFDLPFPYEKWMEMGGKDGFDNWKMIDTPHVESLFVYQDIPGEAIDVMYFTVGRLMHAVGEKDNYGYIGMITGAAGNGKSTFCMHLAKLWEAEDVGVLSNNCEKKFALWPFMEKFLFIAPEVKSDFCLDQAEWQGITTGDPMSIAGKFLKAMSTRWKVPGFFSGNQVPNWTDHGGSVLRRIIQWKFDKRVQRENANLGKEMELEIPMFILKSACAYLTCLKENGGGAIWNWAPDYFKKNRRDLTSRLNPLQNFLDSNLVIKDDSENGKVPLDDFLKELKRHCDSNGFKDYKFHNDTHDTVFADNGMSLNKTQYVYPGGDRTRKIKCVIGCRLRSDDEMDENQEMV